jgi:hypothetical protein
MLQKKPDYESPKEEYEEAWCEVHFEHGSFITDKSYIKKSFISTKYDDK